MIDLGARVVRVANLRARLAFTGNHCARTAARVRLARPVKYLSRIRDFAWQARPRRAPTVCCNDRTWPSTSRAGLSPLVEPRSLFQRRLGIDFQPWSRYSGGRIQIMTSHRLVCDAHE